jgi:hypothetical protein
VSEEYRRHAEACLRILENITDPKERLLMIDMAQTWLRLAREAEKKARLPGRNIPTRKSRRA